MTIGTGAFGGSGLAANLQPSHLMQLTTLAWNADAAVPMPAIHPQQAWQPPSGAVPAYPYASNDPASGHVRQAPPSGAVTGPADDAAFGSSTGLGSGVPDEAQQQLRELIRRLVVEELRDLVAPDGGHLMADR
jgi:hypothetical protein